MNDTPDSERDAKLSSVYRAAATDEPPLSMDDAIRASARRAVAARPREVGMPFIKRWQQPLSAAAVVVVCVSLVTIMHDEGGVLTQTPQPELPASSAVAPPNNARNEGSEIPNIVLSDERNRNLGLKLPEQAADRSRHGKDAYGLATPGSGTGLSPPRGLGGNPTAIAGEAQPAPRSAAAEKNQAASEALTFAASSDKDRQSARTGDMLASAPAPTMREAPGRLATGAPITTTANRADRVATPSATASSAPQTADTRAEARALTGQSAAENAYAVSALAQLPPDQWLARLAELRRLGRHEEARAGLTEFRKRYPQVALPRAVLEGE
jgi:hypothetical protein